MNKNLLNISQKKCITVYKQILKNAQRHIDCAAAISKNRDYGNAIFHLIIGTEETVKALIIFLDGMGLHLRNTIGVKVFFRGGLTHKTRQAFAGIIYEYNIFFKKYLKMHEQLKEIIRKVEEEGLPKSKTDKLFNNIDIHFPLKLKAKVNSAMHWWIQADRLKQNAIYVDYEENLITPFTLNFFDYKKANKYCVEFCHDIFEFIDYFKKLNKYDKQWYIYNANKKNINQLIENIINLGKINIQPT